jgi:hypothetical protein
LLVSNLVWNCDACYDFMDPCYDDHVMVYLTCCSCVLL